MKWIINIKIAINVLEGRIYDLGFKIVLPNLNEARIPGIRNINVIDYTIINPVRCRNYFLHFLIVLKLLLSS